MNVRQVLHSGTRTLPQQLWVISVNTEGMNHSVLFSWSQTRFHQLDYINPLKLSQLFILYLWVSYDPQCKQRLFP
jgi:hypothetical protein